MPHGHCYLWRPDILWLNVGSDALIALAYFAIPVSLIYLVKKRQDLAFNWIFVMFAMFIVACGTTHLIEIWAVWNPQYGLQGLVKLFTAGISIATAIALWPLIPKALALPSSKQVEEINLELRKQIESRQKNDDDVRAILDTAYDAFVAVDGLGLITNWNKQAEATFGWTKDDVIGKPFADTIIPLRFRERHYKGLKRFLETGEWPVPSTRIEMPALRKDGSEVPVELTISPIKRDEGYVFSAFFHDISERKNTEKIQTVHLRVTSCLTEANSISEALSSSLKIICKGLDWDFGAVWIVNVETNKIEPSLFCHDGSEEMAEFETISRKLAFSMGEGIPGRVWQDRQSRWITSLADEQNFPRATFAINAGFQLIVAFPIIAGSEFVGMIEFLGKHPHQLDPKLLEMKADLGSRIGSFVQRNRAEENLRKLYQDLERRVSERTADVAKQAERLKSVVDHVVDGIITINERFEVETWNAAARKIFGYEADEVVGRNVNILMPEPYHGEHDTYVSNYLRTGRAKIIGTGREVVGKRKDGSTFPMDLAVSEFSLGNGRFFTGIVRDITERRRAEESLRKSAADLKIARDAAESANHAKSAFLANMSHEIRTPLGAVLGFAELMLSPEISRSEKEDFVGAIKRNGELLSSIINDILDLSKVEAGKMDVEIREAALAEILTDLTTLLQVQAMEKGVTLTVSSDGAIPGIIMTDPLRLRQILLNIVGNAIKFTERGSVDVTLKLLIPDDSSPRLMFTVKDTGHGISKEQAARLFEPFSQADASTKRKFGGTGLGLVLARRLANLLGGDVILLESTTGKGSTFVITIDPGPIRRSTLSRLGAPADAEMNSHALHARDAFSLQDVNILLTDDAPDNQILVSRLLTLAGAKVTLAANGQEALEKVHQGEYDVLLMDLQMPIMDGYEATATLRKEGCETPIIALTAHALKDERQRCLASGFNDHLSKPIDRHALLETVAHFAGKDAES